MLTTATRVHALDAVRGFALLAGVFLHGAMSFLPGFAEVGWPIVDRTPSRELGVTFYVIHMFRMTTFFFIAGWFGHLSLQRRGLRGFVRDRSVRILVPFIVGWTIVFPLLAATFVWASRDRGAEVRTAGPMPQPDLFTFPLTHLWFLYVLVLLYIVVLAARQIAFATVDANAVGARLDRAVRGLVRSSAFFVVLAAPLAAALYATPEWRRWFGIPTPDQSLIPNFPAAVAFSIAFGFGWLMHRQTDLLDIWRRRWVAHLALAAGLTVSSLALAGVDPDMGASRRDSTTALYALVYAMSAWSWTAAIIGVALQFFNDESRLRRYLSDASYWVYITHLPLVFALQVLVRDLPWHWSLKFAVIVGGASAILLALYHVVVRTTFIGEVLNGSRSRGMSSARAPSAPSTSTPPSQQAAWAELRSVTKRYDKIVALDELDLEVRPGELLAVLGPNGAGKSTAISLLLGLIEPDGGTARLFGQPPGSIEARYRAGVMMQEVSFAQELRVRELIDLVASYYPSPLTPDAALALTRTTALADRPYGKLSAGQKRQVQFAIAICGRPKLLFLDEPTVGLDVQAREALWTTVRELLAQGVSIVLTTHYLEEAEALADRVVVLNKGRAIAVGTVDDIRALVARKHVRCTTSLAADYVREWPGVAHVNGEGGRLAITAIDADAVVRRLLQEDVSARDLEVQRAGLAEAFTELTQEAA